MMLRPKNWPEFATGRAVQTWLAPQIPGSLERLAVAEQRTI